MTIRSPRIGRRHAVGVTAVLALVLGMATPAAADPPGPTDYRTEIVSITPDTPSITVEPVGGDSFIRLTVEPGHDVEVVGYQGEPYLLFGADGVVEQNENSPSRWLNDDRYGQVDPPATAGADAVEDWVVVSTDGSYTWHDHRTHWMNEVKPPGADPGDVVLEAVLPLIVDGVEVDVSVQSTLLAAPSPVLPLAGALAGLITVWIGVRAARDAGGLAAVGLWAMAALAAGAVALRSVPAETGPSRLLWLLPAVALAVCVAGLLLSTRRVDRLILLGAAAVAGVELCIWSWLQRAALTRAFIPTDLPFWLDRFVVAGVAAAGAALVAVAVYDVVRPPPEVRPAG